MHRVLTVDQTKQGAILGHDGVLVENFAFICLDDNNDGGIVIECLNSFYSANLKGNLP